MDIGINYPWQSFDSYGADFGVIRGWQKNLTRREWQAPGEVDKTLTVLDENLLLYVKLGIKVVRWYLLADGLSYGTDKRPSDPKDPKNKDLRAAYAPTPVRERGSRSSLLAGRPTGEWQFNPPDHLIEGFEQDFKDVLRHF